MFEQILIEYRPHLVALLVALIGLFGLYNLHRRKRFHAAADKFRSTVLAELEGIFPVAGYWEQKIYPKFPDTIPAINRAALELIPSLPFYKRTSFSRAVNEYREQCKSMNWQTAFADSVYESETTTTQKEAFVTCVQNLLSFTE